MRPPRGLKRDRVCQLQEVFSVQAFPPQTLPPLVRSVKGCPPWRWAILTTLGVCKSLVSGRIGQVKLSIAIVTYNNEATIGGCLKSIFDNPPGFSFEVFVVDNASADRTPAILNKFPQVKFAKNFRNLGFAKANNQAIKESSGDYVLFLNADAELKPGSVGKMISFMERDKRIGILGPKLVFPSGKIQQEITRFPTLLPMIIWLFRLQKISFFRKAWPLSSYLCEGLDYEKTQEVDHLMGSALLVQRKLFDDIGLLDEDFFFWFEETDFCKRAKESGWKIVYYPEAEVIHHVGASTRQLGPFAIQRMWNQSLATYFKKHGKPWEVWVLKALFPLSYLMAVFAWVGKRLMACSGKSNISKVNKANKALKQPCPPLADKIGNNAPTND